MTVAVAVVLVLRRVDGITNPQFWAEDGTYFFQQNLQPGCWRALRMLVRGFPYLGQRLVACAATPVPFAGVPLVYNLVAYVVAGAGVASFILPWFRHVVRSDALRVVFCLAVAGASQVLEVVGSLTNTSWYLGIWLMLMTIARLPRSPLARAGLSSAVLVATFSAPLVVLTAPLWLVRALHAVHRRRLGDAAFAGMALAGVLALLAVAGDLGRSPDPVPWRVQPVLDVVTTRVLATAALGPTAILSLGTRFGAVVVYAIGLAVLVVLAALARRAARPLLPVLLYCAYGIVAPVVMTFVGRPRLAGMASSVPALLQLQNWFPERYQVLPVAMLYLACLATVDRLPARRRSVATALVVAWLVATQASTFVLPPFYDLQWPMHAAQLERKYAAQSTEPVVIPVNPDRSGFAFHIALDRRAIPREVNVPPEVTLGPLLDGTTFEQTFVARCANLSEIDLSFARTGASTTQTVRIDLRDAESGQVVATFARVAAGLALREPDVGRRAVILEEAARKQGRPIAKEDALTFARIVDELQALYFPPLVDSEGKRYVIAITASGGAPGDAMSLYASTADAYPDGEARRDGRPLPGDLAFRYGCSLE